MCDKRRLQTYDKLLLDARIRKYLMLIFLFESPQQTLSHLACEHSCIYGFCVTPPKISQKSEIPASVFAGYVKLRCIVHYGSHTGLSVSAATILCRRIFEFKSLGK